MVGNYVKHLRKTVCFKYLGEAGEARFAAELVVDPVVVHDVVAVPAARTSFQVGRAVKMRDSEIGEIAGDGAGVLERKVFV